MGCFTSRDIHPVNDYNYNDSMTWNGIRTKNDIKIPLTEKEIFSLTKSWKHISKNMINTGIAMFLSMFEKSAEVRNMFEQFRTVDNVSDLSTSRALENHALLVMNALDEALTNLDDEHYLVEMLLTTGKSHRRFEQFGAHVFWAIEEPFLKAVKEILGDKTSKYLENIYRKAIRFVLHTLILGFKYDGTNFISGSSDKRLV